MSGLDVMLWFWADLKNNLNFKVSYHDLPANLEFINYLTHTPPPKPFGITGIDIFSIVVVV